MADGQKTYTVEAECIVITNRSIRAASFQEALDKTESMKLSDFVTMKGDHMDSRLTISGVMTTDGSALYDG